MTKFLFRNPIALACVLLVTFAQGAYAQLPYGESFKNSTAPGIIFGGVPTYAFLTAGEAPTIANGRTTNPGFVPPTRDAEGSGFLRLTNSANDQKGYIFSEASFPAQKGLRIDVEYFVYNGTNGELGADGICFFLFDANISSSAFKIGGFGGSLGYAPKFENGTPVKGVTGGYLGVGLDEFGNFSNASEGRYLGLDAGTLRRPGNVTLRGAGDSGDPNSAMYPWIATVVTNPNTVDGGYSPPTAPGQFNLVPHNSGLPQERITDQTSPNYRRATVLMEPVGAPVTGYKVSVRIMVGGSPSTTYNVMTDQVYNQVPPALLKYGISASSGAATNVHEIRNVDIRVFDPLTLAQPQAVADVSNSCANRSVVFTPLTNDTSPNEGAFLVADSIDLNPSLPNRQTSFTVAGKGTFTLGTGGSVTFTPINGSVTGPVSCSYTTVDMYSQRSTVGTMTVNDTAPPAIDAGTNQQTTVTAVPSPNNTANLAATIGSGVTGSWVQMSGATTTTFSDQTSATTGVSGMSYGPYVFRFTGRTGVSCDAFDDVTVFVNAIPVAVNDLVTTSTSTTAQIPVLTNDTDANGNTTIDKTTVAIVQQPLHGVVIVDPVTGVVNYTPAIGYAGDDSFLYTVKDNFGVVSNQGLVTISVSIKPVGVDDVMATVLNVPVAANIRTNDGTQLTTTVTVKKTDPANGSVVVTTGGTATYTPNPNFHGLDVFTYVLRNQYGLESDPITVNVSVRPAGTDDVASTGSNSPVIIPVKDNDLGKTGSTVVKKTDPTHGNIVVNADGTVTYMPTTDYQGPDSFTYALVDASALESNPITVTITVKPAGSNDAVSTNVNTPVIISVKDNDLSKTGTTVIKKTDPAHGTAVVNGDGTVTYVPATDYLGDDTFTYALRNSSAVESDPITVTVTVKAKLTTAADNGLTPINTPILLNVKANDPSATGATVIKQTNPTHGTATVNADGSITYTPTTDYYGPDAFTYILRDGGGRESDPTLVGIGVKPAGLNDAYTVALNTTFVAAVKDNDVSKIGTTVIKQGGPSHGTATVNADGTITYVPETNYSGLDGLTYILRTSDPLSSDLITVQFSIKPAGTNDGATGPMNTTIPITVKDNDVSKNGTTVVKKTDPAHGSVALNGDGTINFLPTTDYHGRDVFTYALRTADGVESDPITVTVNIIPRGTNDVAATSGGIPVVVRVKDNDLAKTGTTVIKNTDPLHGTVTVNADGTVTYTPTPGYIGSDTFTYRLRNNDGLESDPITVSIEVRNPPVANNDAASGVVNQVLNIKVMTNDTGDAPLDKTSIVIVSPPAHGTAVLDPSTGEVVYTPNPGYFGADAFTYTIKDTRGLESRPATVAILITSPKIGLAKKLVEVKPATNGSYDIKYLFTIVNYSPFPLYNVSLKDDLLSVFAGTTVTVTKVSHQGALKLNPNFNGSSSIDMLLPGTSSIAALGEEQVELSLNIKLVSREGIFNNKGIVEASTSGGVKVTDQSTDGLKPDPITTGDPTPNVETPVELKNRAIFIPEGYSPNDDGINDKFVIQNTLDKPILLEVYNRWNNLVYKSKDYKNDWDGRTTQGIHVGDYVPSGTYWYIIVIDGVKYNGSITINR